jgi:hypothetical protein
MEAGAHNDITREVSIHVTLEFQHGDGLGGFSPQVRTHGRTPVSVSLRIPGDPAVQREPATAPACEVALPRFYAMSDSLWARVAAILETVDPNPPAGARALLDAVIYRALTGTSWEAMPAIYPPATVVLAAAERWRSLGLFDRLEIVLPVRLSE